MTKTLFVIQKLVKIHDQRHCERLGTWRTITVPCAENQLPKMPSNSLFRVLNSPSELEMSLGAEVKEWTR